MEVRSRRFASNVDMGPCQSARFWKKSFVYLKVAALIGLRGHEQGGKRRREERSLVAAALFKIDAGVALLVREVGVALLLCFYSGRRDKCVYCLCFAGAFTLSKSDGPPHFFLSRVSLP